jgi:hypothetical protein
MSAALEGDTLLDRRTRERLSDAMGAWSAASQNIIGLQRKLSEIDIERAAVEDRLVEQEKLRDNAAALVNETLEDVDETKENVDEVEAILAPFIGVVSTQMSVVI